MAVLIHKRRSRTRCIARTPNYSLHLALLFPLLLACISDVDAIHHMQRRAPRRLVPRQSNDSTPLVVTNWCSEDIYPGINTQSGHGPSDSGFKLRPGEQKNLTVSENWQGRVWGRANCSFNDDGTGPSNGAPGKACASGDCNGVLNCKVGGDTPVTLAEFTLDAGDGQTYYDISLVDGYNLPMALELEPFGNVTLEEIPPNLTNPCCSATAGLLAPQDWNPYVNGQTFLDTNASCQLPMDSKVDSNMVLNWCPWNLQVNMPNPPDDGVYTYPDNSVQRPAFNPCYSACAKWNLPQDCCTGQYNKPSNCQPSEYSKAAKQVCPDAYSYAFDDQTSTFIIPSGVGFNVIFCPGGRSSNILTAESSNVSSASGGQVQFGGGSKSSGAGSGGARNSYYYPHRDGRSSMEHFTFLAKREEYDWTGVENLEEAIGGIKILELKWRELHLSAWVDERRQELIRREGLVRSVFRKRSSATAVGVGEVKSTTWYLMCAGLFVTAAVFVML